ncbi:serine hydrolase [Streptomyces sp. Z26]|uniref:D-alanyl-D-alanine carboxypeptidase family protein n=1 Tax=Streptomyces TaxID=1883 RepID=UPI000EF144BF|nr:serine hydrolase [Streptomyces sp. Z26]RLL68092.1 D-alanyl-D-alanine carboxypeptidase [Streptomyces sp. Z26]
MPIATRSARRWGIGLTTVATTVTVLATGTPAQAAGTAAAAPSGVGAKGAYLLDAGSGKKLWSKGDTTKRQMASTTKIMTAIVALQTKGALDKQITVKQEYRDYVTREGASTADLRTGDKLKVKQLLPALMLPSGCDAAYAIADAIGSGSSVKARTKSFIGKMNKTADELGLKNTEFDSFDGISPGGDNYTTPGDLAKMAQHALKNTTFASTVKTTTAKEVATNGRTYTWTNTNQLLGSYKGAIGVKTGSGTAAGPCLVFAAKRDGKTVVGVVLYSKSAAARYTDAKAMLDWAYGTQTKQMKLRELPAGAQRD